MGDVITPTRRFRRWSVLPWVGAAALAWLSALVGPGVALWEYVLSLVLALSAVPLRLLSVSHERHETEVLPALAFLAGLALLRDAAGGSTSGLAIVALVPALYLALHSPGLRALYVYLAAMAVFYLAPIVLIGAPEYPDAQYRAALLSVATAAIVGVTTQKLVVAARRDAEEAQHKGAMLEAVSKVVRELYTSSDVRADVCEAARRVGEASAAGLYEPVAGRNVLRASASAGFDAAGREVALDVPSAMQEAFLSGRAILLSENVSANVNPALWEAAGRPECVLYEPLMQDAEAVGVLAVAWPSALRAGGPRATVVALLAHEAAGVIARGDAMTELVDTAGTDALTGLPNRRTWDAQVTRASSASGRFTVAMLDLDHFKQYNDRHGHLAGDRLLKQTASNWRDQLREGDLVARVGGEEFGLLLRDCDTARAIDVIERLRAGVVGGSTCSAGFAERRAGESAIAVMARADQALYDAKAAGRDRAMMSS